MQRLRKRPGWLSIEFVLLLWAVLFGGIVRLAPLIAVKFPVNDGGLFYVMAQDIQKAQYVLPTYTSFNSAQIPFAYPPLGLYLAAALNEFAGLPLLEIFRWLSPLLSILTIPAFYLVSVALSKSRFHAAAATLVYALLPRTYTLLVMGGGLPRVLGTLFLMLNIYFVYLLFTTRKNKHLLAAILTASLVILSHPENSLHAVVVVCLFGLFWGGIDAPSFRPCWSRPASPCSPRPGG